MYLNVFFPFLSEKKTRITLAEATVDLNFKSESDVTADKVVEKLADSCKNCAFVGKFDTRIYYIFFKPSFY